ncbi:hypothetical protein HYALB_00007848 [Hymenoscyphus albidus]|uniref:Uncharacterized protein n=1 Tax=Hymenoscyphus albidus TaxID=595503 RepID=A0A9N9LI34_9HELO|nr:hypothetical protein HYALB_00007848 [Hymenoscyphus albidus]
MTDPRTHEGAQSSLSTPTDRSSDSNLSDRKKRFRKAREPSYGSEIFVIFFAETRGSRGNPVDFGVHNGSMSY